MRKKYISTYKQNKVIERDKRVCQFCDCKINSLPKVVALTDTNKGDLANFVTCCIDCYTYKANNFFSSFHLTKLYVQYQHILHGNLLHKNTLLSELQTAILSYAKMATLLHDSLPTAIPLSNPFAEIQAKLNLQPRSIDRGVLIVALWRM